MKQRTIVRHRTQTGLVAGLLLTGGFALASGLQVAPVGLELQATQSADGLWLSNTGTGVLRAQVRVFHWAQKDGADELTPSRGLVISPPMLELAAGARQLVRVIRAGAPPSGKDAVEDAYRVIVNELPVDRQGKAGLQYVLRYSVPVFVEPANKTTVAPALSWSLSPAGDHVMLDVVNNGDGHAQVSAVEFVNAAGTRTPVEPGLLGYVLPGQHVRWALKPAASVFAGGGTFEARVNGDAVEQPVAMDTAAR
jgi:fimbrial chaperone protein